VAVRPKGRCLEAAVIRRAKFADWLPEMLRGTSPKRQHIELTDQIVWASAADYCITSRSRCGEP
jgi:hypothetical protein